MFDEDVGNSAHFFRSSDGMIPLRHGTRGLLYDTTIQREIKTMSLIFTCKSNKQMPK